MQVILEAILKNKPDQVIGQGDQEILVDKRRRNRDKDMLKPGRTKEGLRAMTPYMKGVHLTLDSWRPYRDGEGWRLQG